MKLRNIPNGIVKILKRWNNLSLVIRIFIGLALGIILGLKIPEWIALGIPGTLFVGALKAIAPVLVAVLVASSIARAHNGLGSRFRTVIFLYLFATVFAAVTAVIASEIFPLEIVLKAKDSTENGPSSLLEVFKTLTLNMVSNPVAATSSANYIGVLFWSVILGFALKTTESHTAIKVISELSNVVSKVVSWVIQLAPIGIMGLVFTAVSENGLDIFTVYGQLILLLVGCMLFVALVVNPLLSFICIRQNPYPLVFKCLKESGLNAFFTRSSAANIPVNMELCKKLNIDRDFYAVSIPLGATINMSGAAITITIMTLAVCHTLGTEVSIPSALILSLIAALGACGASGVAGGSLLLIPMACSLFNINNDIAMEAVAVGFVIGVVQDSFETALNSSSDVLFSASAEMLQKRHLQTPTTSEPDVSSDNPELPSEHTNTPSETPELSPNDV